MSLQTEIGLLKKELDKINDGHLIQAIKELIKFAHQKHESNLLEPFTRQQIVSRARQSEKNIKEKKYKSVEAVRKSVKSW